MSENNG